MIAAKDILVSVIVPAFNREATIARSINSVLAQTHTKLELLIVDDGSADSTLEIATALMRSDARMIVLVNARTKGAPGARNTGLDHATGTYVVFLDSDDCLEPRMIETLISQAINKPPATIITCHSRLVEESEGKETTVGSFTWTPVGMIVPQLLNGQTYVDMNAALIATQILREVGGLDESCPSFQEWDLHLRLAEKCHYSSVPELLVRYYQHAEQMSKSDRRNVQGRLYIYRKHRALWRQHHQKVNWKHRVMELLSQIQSFKKDRFAFLMQLVTIEPKMLVWWLTESVKAIAGPVLRRRNPTSFT